MCVCDRDCVRVCGVSSFQGSGFKVQGLGFRVSSKCWRVNVSAFDVAVRSVCAHTHIQHLNAALCVSALVVGLFPLRTP